MPFIEAPTTFYMGRRFDPTTRRLVDEVVYYDSRDLTTHAVVVGMTGSGKTGLCITLLEEAVMDNIPSIIIDPKGDITNLLLAFPELRPEDFEPWVNVDDARRAGLDVHEYAQDVAQQWRDGLASWSITPQRIAYFKQNARFSIYTPGSDAGLPVSILDAMQAPAGGFEADEEANRERVAGIVTAMLALIGKNADPVKDREHILLSNIFEYNWRQGINLTLDDVILQVQKPPFPKLGVFDVDTFFPEKDRFALAMELNNIIASPRFQSWIHGEPLDIQNLLYTPEGKPRVSIIHIAHLNDAERMFIVTLLLENMLAWMHTLSGTTSLRAILYFDEVFGFFPPHPYNPPSKDPMLRLLKQARAFGLGMVLATQNPGDIDYKGLSNAGTWFIGKLQTENDKAKVLSGLQTVAAAESYINVEDIGKLLSTIGPRVFVMNNVHDNSGPIPMHTRWAMCYLRGPLTRQQIRILMADQRDKPYYPAYQPQPYQQPAAAPYQQAAAPQITQPYGTPIVPPPSPLPGRQTGIVEPPIARGSTPPPTNLPEMPPALPEFDNNIPPAPAAPPAAPPVRPSAVQPDLTQPAANSGGLTQPNTNMLPSRPVAQPQGTRGTRQENVLPEGYTTTPPPLPGSMAQYFLPSQISMEQAVSAWERQTGMDAKAYGGSIILYKPILIAQAQVRYADRKSNVNMIQSYAYHIPNLERAGLVQWDEYAAEYIDPKDMSQEPFGEAAYGTLASGLTDSKRLTALRTELVDYLSKTIGLSLMYNSQLDYYGEPGIRRRDFLVQAQNLARQRRDEEIDQVTAQYEKQFDAIETRLRKRARELASDKKQLDAIKNEEMFTMGEAALSLLRGRTTYTLSRVSRARRYKGNAQDSVFSSEAEIADMEQQLDDTQAKLEADLAQINAKWGETAAVVEEYRLTPYKKDIYLDVFGIGWKPYWLIAVNGAPTLIPAMNEPQQTPPAPEE